MTLIDEFLCSPDPVCHRFFVDLEPDIACGGVERLAVTVAVKKEYLRVRFEVGLGSMFAETHQFAMYTVTGPTWSTVRAKGHGKKGKKTERKESMKL